MRQELGTSPSCVTARQEGSRGAHWHRTRWAAPSDAPSLGLRMAMELRALFLLLLCFPGRRRAQRVPGDRDNLPHFLLPVELPQQQPGSDLGSCCRAEREGQPQFPAHSPGSPSLLG